MPRTFHCVIYLLGSIRNHSVSQRAFASQHGEKAHGFALYGRHRVAGKREGCVLSSAKINDTFRIIAISSRKISIFFDKKERTAKTSGFFLDSSLVLCFSSLVSAESRAPFPHSPPAAVSRTRRHARERTRTGASRTQRLCISCLHPSPPHLNL